MSKLFPKEHKESDWFRLVIDSMKLVDGESKFMSNSFCLVSQQHYRHCQTRRFNSMRFRCCSKYNKFEVRENKAAHQFYYAHLNEKVLKTHQIRIFSLGQGTALVIF